MLHHESCYIKDQPCYITSRFETKISHVSSQVALYQRSACNILNQIISKIICVTSQVMF